MLVKSGSGGPGALIGKIRFIGDVMKNLAKVSNSSILTIFKRKTFFVSKQSKVQKKIFSRSRIKIKKSILSSMSWFLLGNPTTSLLIILNQNPVLTHGSFSSTSPKVVTE